MSANTHAVSDDQFESEVLKSETPVLVDFWAPWCQPCKMISPVVDEIAEHYQGRLKVVKVNVDDNPETPANYGVRGIPSLLVFKEGNVVATKVGAVNKSQLTAFIDEHI